MVTIESIPLLVDITRTAEAACDLASRRQYAALVLDAGTVAPMAILDRLGADEQPKDIPIIVASEDRAVGCGSFAEPAARLAKPLNEVSLRAALDAVLSPPQAEWHILYVEDDTFLHEIFQQHLGENVRMTSAATLAEARACIAARDFDLVLLDLELPDGPGEQLVKEIAPTTPILVFSAYDIDTEIARNVASVMTKSRVKEAEVAKTAAAILAKKPASGSSHTMTAE
ncbi:response regulator [Palleronia abyssalis]|uniref:Regulator of RpoS n=1 Tax=Palleronia abyssalis TaxID=1501240 RepID=A0A2R8C1S6_9RHOB|nr:response regulator [Palleronia abyssalis]SPJ26375.1 Regulator of RpoS [Palleronia abyssalis]